MKLYEAQHQLIGDLEDDLEIALTNSEKSLLRQFLVHIKKITGDLCPEWLKKEDRDSLKIIIPELMEPDYFGEYHLTEARNFYLFLYLNDAKEVYHLGKGANVPYIKEKFRKSRAECFLL